MALFSGYDLPLAWKDEVALIRPPPVVTGGIDELELEVVDWRFRTNRERELVVLREVDVEILADYRISAMSLEIEIEAHRLAVKTCVL